MKLHEEIESLLINANKPMSINEIIVKINNKSEKTIEANQVYSSIKNYPSIFQNINGSLVLVNNSTWKKIFTSYEYLSHVLKGIFIPSDIQFIIAVLFFYKRLLDINKREGRGYPLVFDDKFENTLHRLIDGGRSLIYGFESLEDYFLAPKGTFKECARLISSLDNSKIQEIWLITKNVQTEHLNDSEFGNIYEYLITSISPNNTKSSFNSTPYSLRHLMSKLLSIKPESSVYDPVAGLGGLLIEVATNTKKSIQIYGSEINRRISQLGSMNIIMYGLDNVSITTEDCFEKITTNKTYDYIIGDLPINGITNSLEYHMIYNKYGFTAPKSGKGFGALILLTLLKLKPEGKAVLTVSDSFLSKKGNEQQIRELLINQDIIETIISLPNGTLRPYTDAKSSIIVLNKKKPTHLKKQIQFILGSITDLTSKSAILNNDEILQLYKQKEILHKNSQIIHIQELKPNVNLLAESYDSQFSLANTMLMEGKAKLLGDLVQIKTGANTYKQSINKNGKIPLVKVENLSKEILDINLVVEEYDGVNNNLNYDKSIISEKCILIARIGDNLKATLFTPTKKQQKILLHSNVYALIPHNKSNLLDIEYLYYQLYSTFVQQQIDKRRMGAIMPYINMSELKDVVIPYMSLESQKEFIHSQKANLVAVERNRIEERIKAIGYKEETKQAESDVIKVLTHQLMPTFSGLNGITNRIERIITRESLGELLEYDDIVFEVDPEIVALTSIPDNFTLNQLVKKLSEETRHLNDILTNVDKVMNFKLLPEDLQNENVLDFLNEYKNQKAVEQNSKFSLEVKGDKAFVNLHKPSFKELLDQLLLNAEKHAFADSYSELNKVVFNVRNYKSRNVVSIEYSNNGKPFELTQRDFKTAFEKGNKSKGSGIGGNYISRIIEAHQGKMIVQENIKTGFLLIMELPAINNLNK